MQTVNISADRVQPGTFYGCDGGMFYIRVDGGLNYNGTMGSSIGLPTGECGSPVVNFNKAGQLLLALGSSGVYHIKDFGSSWESVGPASLEAEFFSISKGSSSHNFARETIFLWGRIATSGPVVWLVFTGLMTPRRVG